MRLYLDLDGTLLRRNSGAKCAALSLAPAEGLDAFLDWATTHFDCHWLTSRHRDGGLDAVVAAFRQAVGPGERCDRLAELSARIAPTSWDRVKAEGIDLTQDFLWLDDAPDEDSLDLLAAKGLESSWIAVELDRRADDLFRVMDLLKARLDIRRTA